MRYLPLTPDDRTQMLETIGVSSIDALFTDVPESARLDGPVDLPRKASGRHPTLGEIVDDVVGRHLTINATGATAAVLMEVGIPVPAMRGFAVVARAAGLLAHLVEERETPTAMHIWETVEHAIPYDGDAPVNKES